MALPVSDVISKVQLVVNDTAGKRWNPTTVLIPWLVLGMLEIAKHRDDAYQVRQSVQLVGGTNNQVRVLPDDTIKLLSINYNMGADGATPGRAITRVDSLAVLDRSRRAWRRDPKSDVIENWCPSDPDPRSFFTYPAPWTQSPVWVEAVFTRTPPAVTALTDTIPIRSIYSPQLQWFTEGMALMQDIESGNQPRGMGFLQLFYNSLGVAVPPQAQP